MARIDALWKTRYRSAGPQRNAAMLDLLDRPELDWVEAFVIEPSRGTSNCIRQARMRGLLVEVHRWEG